MICFQLGLWCMTGFVMLFTLGIVASTAESRQPATHGESLGAWLAAMLSGVWFTLVLGYSLGYFG